MPAKGKSKRVKNLSDVPMSAVPVAMSRTKEDKARERRYAAEEALRTLTRADEHRANPRLMADVKRLAADQANKMARIAKR
jgi:hypothetical protein